LDVVCENYVVGAPFAFVVERCEVKGCFAL
jgi:hypothetical protein